MNDIVKECIKLVESIGDTPFDKALPDLQEGLWKIANKHNTTGPRVLQQYLDWKSKQSK